MRKSTEETLKKMRSMYEAGTPIEEIASELGYKADSVKTMLRKAGVFRRRNIDDYLQQMIQMRLEGKRLGEISRATGFSIPKICEKLKEVGCGKNSMRDTYAESDIDESKLTYAKPGENPERITHTDETFPCDVWQQYASPVWMDIKQSDTLRRKSARDEKDERHICPLQLEVIKRGIELWTNPGDIVFDPFMGIGSSPYVAVRLGRRGTGIELKESYYTQAENNLKIAALEESIPSIVGQMSIFDFPEVMP